MKLRLLKSIIFSLLVFSFSSSFALSQPLCPYTIDFDDCRLEASAENCLSTETFCSGGGYGSSIPYFCCPSELFVSIPPQPSTPSTTSTPTVSQPASGDIQNRHPLRPKPNELTTWEKDRPNAGYTQTTFCAQRPTAVQKQEFLKKDKELTLHIEGTYTSNFEEFITPLLSITNTAKDDYNLPYEKKAQQYLADYLGGRAYYEIQAENPNDPTIASRLGVFRKLAPKDIQDKYKRAMIYRATGIPSSANPNGLDPMDFFTDYYGFEPASPTVRS